MINCSDCNANCCRQVGKFSYMKDYDRGDGTCKYLDQDNRCMIYENRPQVCNTDLLYERYYSRFMTREQYDKANSEACEQLRKATR